MLDVLGKSISVETSNEEVLFSYNTLNILKNNITILEPVERNFLKVNNIDNVIINSVQESFSILDKHLESRDLKNINNEILSYNNKLLKCKEIESFYSENVYVRNHMYCVKINISLDNGPILNDIDLEFLSNNIIGAYYCKKKTPSMMIFDDEIFCCAVLTRKGNINIVGGNTQCEVKYVLIKFLCDIYKAYSKLSKNIKISSSSVELFNIAISTCIPLTKIDILNATSYLQEYNISFKYIPELHNILIVKPLQKSNPSVYVRIFPSGGIFSFGYKSLKEINIVMGFIASVIKPHSRQISPLTSNALSIWRINNRKNWELQEANKKKRREKKLKQWGLTKA